MQDFNLLTKFLRERRSVYPNQYIDREIDPELIMEILENANHAPTHRLTQPWRFKVVAGDKRKELGNFLAEQYELLCPPKKYNPAKKEKSKIKCSKADKIILICMQRDPKKSVPKWEEIAATSMAVQNIYLSCSALNIGCYWSTPKAIEFIDQFTHLAEGEECIGLFYMGYYEEGKEFPKSPRSSISDKLEWLE